MIKTSNVDYKQFLNIQKPEVAYLLGLLWADGHVSSSKNELLLVTTYPDSIEFYRQFKKCGKWNFYKYNNKNKKLKMAISSRGQDCPDGK